MTLQSATATNGATIPASANPHTGRMTSKAFWWALLPIVGLGFAIRVNFVASSTVRAPTGDPAYYYYVANNIAKGHGFTFASLLTRQEFATAYHPPGHLLLLAFFISIGVHTPQALRYMLCVLGSTTIIIIGVLVRRIVSARAALIAALIVAIYPPIWINPRMLMSETLFLFAFALTLWFAYATIRSPSAGNVAGMSLSIGLAASARPESLLLYALIALPAIVHRIDLAWRRRLILLTLAAALPVLMFSPWVLYNSKRFHVFLPTSTGFGATLLQGNCDATYYGENQGYYSLSCLRLASTPADSKSDEVVRDRNARTAALRYMRHHLKRIPTMIVLREGRTWGVYDPAFTVNAEADIERDISVRLAWAEMVSYWAVALLAIPGFVVLRRRRIPVYPLLAMIGITTFVAGISFGLTRYRVGADLCLIIFAASTLDAIARQVGRRMRAPRPVPDVGG